MDHISQQLVNIDGPNHLIDFHSQDQSQCYIISLCFTVFPQTEYAFIQVGPHANKQPLHSRASFVGQATKTYGNKTNQTKNRGRMQRSRIYFAQSSLHKRSTSSFCSYLCGHLLSTLLFVPWRGARFQERGEAGAGRVGCRVL